jgi:hypothetical protein
LSSAGEVIDYIEEFDRASERHGAALVRRDLAPATFRISAEMRRPVPA